MMTTWSAKQLPTVRVAMAVLFAAAVVGGRAQGAEPIGWVTELEGAVQSQHAGTDSWVTLAPAAELSAGDHVRTAAESRAKLLLRDDSVLTLAPDSEITLDEQVAGPVPVARMGLLVGKVRALVTERYGAPGSKFELQTTNAITGVRGTSFVASYNVAGEETLVVGLIDTTTVRARGASAGREVRLGPGQETRVRRGSLPTNPTHVSDTTLRGLMGATTLNTGPGAAPTPGGKATVAEPRVPRRPGDRNGSPEGRTIDQPVDRLRGPGGVPPPPPPVPR